MDPLVSVVLPIYNVEKYLDDCISSVINQTYRNLQIILVDDGSPDNCPQKCDAWSKKDERIQVIHQENQGLGEARNSGISYALGKYIFFYDSDDYLNLNLISKCVCCAERYNADFVIYGFSDVTMEGNYICDYIPVPSKNVIRGNEIKTLFIKQLYANNKYKGEDWNIRISAWNCMFSKSIVDERNFRFVSERKIISEDIYSMLSYYTYIKTAIIIDESLYYHRINKQSLSHTYREDRFQKLTYFYEQLTILCRELKLDDETVSLMANPYISGTIDAIKMIVRSENPYSKKLALLSNIVFNDKFNEAISLSLKFENTLSKKILLLALRNKNVKIVYLLIKLKK